MSAGCAGDVADADADAHDALLLRGRGRRKGLGQRGDGDRAAGARLVEHVDRERRMATSSSTSKNSTWSSRAANMRRSRCGSSSKRERRAVDHDGLVGGDAQHERGRRIRGPVAAPRAPSSPASACGSRTSCSACGVSTMKMMSSTRTTSTSGVTFIVGATPLPRPLPPVIAMAQPSSPAVTCRLPARCVPLADQQRHAREADLLAAREDVTHGAVRHRRRRAAPGGASDRRCAARSAAA